MSYFEDNLVKIYNKDCRSMADLPDEYVQCMVTSPPYWGLRKYSGLPDLVWGGNGNCEHKWGMIKPKRFNTVQGGEAQRPHNFIMEQNYTQGSFCSLCGAWSGQLGLEPTPEMYISHLVDIFREVKRVLRKDGVVFLNIGDSYVSGKSRYSSKEQTISGKDRGDNFQGKPDQYYHKYLKDKDLCLIPFRLAIALQEDGWWVRSVIIWNKPNPMPESVTDRPTESHEYILMLTKSAKYYWDAEAVREPQSKGTFERYGNGNGKIPTRIKLGGSARANESFLSSTPDAILPNGRNLRSVWTFPTQPYPEAHFATYPEKLVELCVKAATPEVGCCSKCGKPWVRIVETRHRLEPKIGKGGIKRTGIISQLGISQHSALVTQELPIYQTLGWKPQCKCNADKVPSIVLDPFLGSGTTIWVAKKLGRRGVGYELSEEYCALALDRNRQQALV